VNAAAEEAKTPGDAGKPPSRRGPASARGRGDSAASSHGRGAHEARGRRSSEQRFAGWGDGIERAFCVRAAHGLPATFPVASRAGAATIAATVVARRPQAILLCTFGHCDAHVWPDGEVVAETAGNGERQRDAVE
jgi:hypothetical protein